MKQKDIALIIVVVIFSAVFSLLLARFLFAQPKDRSIKAEVVDAISTEFIQPSSKHFNDKSFNPTQSIQIGESSNTAPFGNR